MSDNSLKISFLVAEDHLMIGKIVSAYLKEQYPSSQFTWVPSVSALEKLEERKFTLIILDLDLSDGSSIRWLESHANSKVLVLSCAVEEAVILKVLGLRIVGFVHKSDDPDCLYHAVRVALEGGFYLSPKVQSLRNEFNRRPDALHKILSEREREILRFVGMGLSSGEIASKLGLRASSVSDHKKNLMTKLDAHSVQDLMLCAINRGLLRA
jgi:DNA-binding NarL/FixJ family response regulator